MPETKKDDLYIGIKEPLDVRKTLLESSRLILKLLQRNERFKSLRDEKKELRTRLKKLTKEILDLETKLKTKLPKQTYKKLLKKSPNKKVEEMKVVKNKAKNTGKKKTQKTVKETKPVSELDKLESSLNDIETKLRNLS